MKKGRTELVFILDRSGSMAGLEKDTIGGYNAMLEKQRAVEEECFVTTVLFDNEFELLHDRVELEAVASLTEAQYRVGGSTALLDAIGTAIRKIGNAQRNTAEAYRAEKVLFVILTDGEENASRCYDADRIRVMITRQKESYGWEFLFLGANIDSVQTAGRFGIAPDRVQNYHADSRGVELNFSVMSEAVKSFRTGCLSEDWGDAIRADYVSREKEPR